MGTKEVRFDEYCKKCVHYEKRESEDPCFDCLDQGWNYDSHKPILFEEKESETKAQTRNQNEVANQEG